MKDLTKGSPLKLILSFVFPVFLGNIFQQLYNMADTVIVGHTVNSDAFTGVGLTGSVSFLVLGFISGLTAGFGVRVAQRFGANDAEGVRKSVAMSFLLAAVIAVAVSAVAVPLAGPLLRLMNTPAQYYDYAYSYLLVIFSGIAATAFYNILASVLRAIGDSKTPLVFLIVAAVLNVGLDFLFIVGFGMHYRGAATATILSQFLSGVACLVYMLKRYPELRLKRADWKWSFAEARAQIVIGLPMALQFSITAIGCIVQQTALNGLETDYPGVATAYTAASKIDNLANQTFPALGTAMATYAGQNYGAGRMDRVKRGVAASMLCTVISAVLGFAFCMGLYTPLMGLFLDTEKGGAAALYYEEVMAYGRQYLLFQSAGYLLLGTIFVFRNTLQGIGKSAVTTLAGVTELGGRVLTAFVFVRLWGFTGACMSNPIAWLAADLFLIGTYCAVVVIGENRKRRMRRKALAGA